MKKIFIIFITSLLAISMIGTMTVKATEPSLSRMEDYADLLDAEAERNIRNLLDEKSRELEFDLVIVTTESTGGKSSQDYADDFYDYNGYGWGENYDGALLLINMEYREWHISTTGYGMDAITNSEVYEIGDELLEDLSYGDYEAAFERFAKLAEKEVKKEKDSEVLSIGEILLRLVLAIVIGMGLAFIPVSVMKKKMNNVEMREEATEYMKRNQLRMTQQRDMYLYSTISRARKPENNSSRSGGGHIGSSGRSHGGGGGRF